LVLPYTNGYGQGETMKFIPRVSLLFLVFYSFFVYAESNYQFERMWPNLPQPWYFGDVNDLESNRDGNFYVLVSRSNIVSNFDGNGNLIRQWLVPYSDIRHQASYDLLKSTNEFVYIMRIDSTFLMHLLKYDHKGQLISDLTIPKKVGDIDLYLGSGANSFAIDESNIYLHSSYFSDGILVKYNIDTGTAISIKEYSLLELSVFSMEVNEEGQFYVLYTPLLEGGSVTNSSVQYIEQYTNEGVSFRTLRFNNPLADEYVSDVEIFENILLVNKYFVAGKKIAFVDIYNLENFNFVKSIPVEHSVYSGSSQVEMNNADYFYHSLRYETQKI